VQIFRDPDGFDPIEAPGFNRDSHVEAARGPRIETHGSRNTKSLSRRWDSVVRKASIVRLDVESLLKPGRLYRVESVRVAEDLAQRVPGRNKSLIARTRSAPGHPYSAREGRESFDGLGGCERSRSQIETNAQLFAMSEAVRALDSTLGPYELSWIEA